MSLFDGRSPPKGPRPSVRFTLTSGRILREADLGALPVGTGEGTSRLADFPKLVKFLARFGEFLSEDTLPTLCEIWPKFRWDGDMRDWVGRMNSKDQAHNLELTLGDAALKIRLQSNSSDLDGEHFLCCVNSATLRALYLARAPNLEVFVTPLVEFERSSLLGFPHWVDLELRCFYTQCPERAGVTFVRELLNLLENPELVSCDPVNNRRVKAFLDARASEDSFKDFKLPLSINPTKDARQLNNSDRPKHRANTLLALVGPGSPDK